MEDVAAGLDLRDDRLDNAAFVQTEGASQVGGRGRKQSRSEEVSNARCELSIKVPAVDTAALDVASARNEVAVGLLLLFNEFCDEFGLNAREVCDQC